MASASLSFRDSTLFASYRPSTDISHAQSEQYFYGPTTTGRGPPSPYSCIPPNIALKRVRLYYAQFGNREATPVSKAQLFRKAGQTGPPPPIVWSARAGPPSTLSDGVSVSAISGLTGIGKNRRAASLLKARIGPTPTKKGRPRRQGKG